MIIPTFEDYVETWSDEIQEYADFNKLTFIRASIKMYNEFVDNCKEIIAEENNL